MRPRPYRRFEPYASGLVADRPGPSPVVASLAFHALVLAIFVHVAAPLPASRFEIFAELVAPEPTAIVTVASGPPRVAAVATRRSSRAPELPPVPVRRGHEAPGSPVRVVLPPAHRDSFALPTAPAPTVPVLAATVSMITTSPAIATAAAPEHAATAPDHPAAGKPEAAIEPSSEAAASPPPEPADVLTPVSVASSVPAAPGPPRVAEVAAPEPPPAAVPQRAPESPPAVAEPTPKPTPKPTTKLAGAAASGDAHASSKHARSMFGLGFGRPRIEIDGERSRTTEREVEILSGRVVGGAVQRVLVRSSAAAVPSILTGTTFTTAVKLEHGVNLLHVVAIDGQGGETDEVVAVEYRPPGRAGAITISSPRDGETIAATAPPVVVAEGAVGDPGITTARLRVNDAAYPLQIVDGRYRATVPVLTATAELKVEGETPDGRRSESPTVTVRAASRSDAGTMLALEWPAEAARSAKLVATWRSNPGRLDLAPQPALYQLIATGGGARPEIFYFADPRPGVYTLTLTYDPVSPVPAVKATIYVPRAGALGAMDLHPVALAGKGKLVLARILLPYGVLWEQDDFFSGQSTTAETITKFRAPEGITWTERKVGLR